MKLVLIHVYLESNDPSSYQQFLNRSKALKDYATSVSISPARDYGDMAEIYMTLEVEAQKIEPLLHFMSTCWEGEDGDYLCNNFTGKLYDDTIYSLHLEVIDD